MSYRLSSHIAWVTPHIYPRMADTGHRFLAAFAESIFEFDDEGKTATTIAHIHRKVHFAVTLGRERLCRAMPGYVDPVTPDHPTGKPRISALDRGLREAPRWGALRTLYIPDRQVTTHVLIPPVEAAVARAVALRDVRAHVRQYPIAEVAFDGVSVDARKVGGQWERTRGKVHPTTPDETVDALALKVDLEYVGQIKASQVHPEWLPTGFEFADALRALASDLTGAPVVESAAPRVRYEFNRVDLTDDLLELVPGLRALVRPASDAGTELEAIVGSGEALAGDETKPPARKPKAAKSDQSASHELAFTEADLAMLRGQRGVA